MENLEKKRGRPKKNVLINNNDVRIINAIPKNMAIARLSENTSDYKTITDEVNDILRKEKITPINREELLYLCHNQIFSGKIIPLPKPPTKEDLVKYFTNLSGKLMPPKEELLIS